MGSRRRCAPWYPIPPSSSPLVNIEHPCIIKNVDKGIQTLGGIPALSKLAQASENLSAKLYLKPGYRDAKPVVAANIQTNDIVLEISVPKRTGRKRKRGSDDAYTEQDQLVQPYLQEEGRRTPSSLQKPTQKMPHLLRSLHEHAEAYRLSIVGRVEQTHRFRTPPDFVLATKNNAFMEKMRQTILPFEYSKLKDFKFDMSKGIKPLNDLIAPPRWDLQMIPFNYNYQQNPNVKVALNPIGTPQFIVQGLPIKQLNQHTASDAPTVPAAPSPLLPLETTLDPLMQRIIAQARHLFTTRPIWTRRALYNNLDPADFKALGWNGTKHVQQYVGYSFDSGPWRDSIVRFGLDPRTDPEYRIYQTMMFQLEPQSTFGRSRGELTMIKRDWKTVAELQERKSHLFDGVQVHTDGKTWQVCDVTDPLLASIFNSATLRSTCHLKLDGWYQNGVFSKAKIIMKNKMRRILEGNPISDEEFAPFAHLPDVLGPDTRARWIMDKSKCKNGKATQEQITMIGDMRTAAARTQEVRGKEVTPVEERGEEGEEGSEESGEFEEEGDEA